MQRLVLTENWQQLPTTGAVLLLYVQDVCSVYFGVSPVDADAGFVLSNELFTCEPTTTYGQVWVRGYGEVRYVTGTPVQPQLYVADLDDGNFTLLGDFDDGAGFTVTWDD